MGSRVQLHNLLLGITPNVYFQAPENLKMNYPCIRYSRTSIDINSANDTVYNLNKSYTIMLITSDADSTLADQLAVLPMCAFVRQYQANNLYHDVFNIYY